MENMCISKEQQMYVPFAECLVDVGAKNPKMTTMNGKALKATTNKMTTTMKSQLPSLFLKLQAIE